MACAGISLISGLADLAFLNPPTCLTIILMVLSHGISFARLKTCNCAYCNTKVQAVCTILVPKRQARPKQPFDKTFVQKKVYMYIHRYSYYHYYIVWLFLGFLCRGVFGPTEVPHNGVVWGTIRHNTPKQWTPTYVIKPPKWNCGSPDIPRPQILGMVPHNHRDWISSCNITVLFWDQAI